jgi:cystathionine beta-lyase/cystathionine gamma-synthase
MAARPRPNTKVVYMESPGSLTFEVQDVSIHAADLEARFARLAAAAALP